MYTDRQRPSPRDSRDVPGRNSARMRLAHCRRGHGISGLFEICLEKNLRPQFHMATPHFYYIGLLMRHLKKQLMKVIPPSPSLSAWVPSENAPNYTILNHRCGSEKIRVMCSKRFNRINISRISKSLVSLVYVVFIYLHI